MGLLDRFRGAPGRSVEAPYVTSDGKYAVQVVGESHYQEALKSVCGGKTKDGHHHPCHAALVREPRNEHDSNAIAVQIEGRKVGHLSRDDAAKYAAVMDKARTPVVATDAIVRGGWDRGGSDHGHYGVTLDLPAPAELGTDLQ